VNIIIMFDDESNTSLQRIAHSSSSSNSNRTQLGTEHLDCAKPEAAITPWTTAKAIDELISELALANIYIENQECGSIRIIPKYYSRAQEIMYRIPVYRPDPPIFEVDVKDLSCQLQSELAGLKKSDHRMFDYVLKIAVMHIFENIRFDYAHQSVMPDLRIRFVDK
jgi:hypothetical protein